MKPEAAPRPKQETPAQLVADVMTMIRGQWYGDLDAEKWFQDQAFIKKHVVLWPARWLNKRGLTLPPDRYFAILIEKLNDVKRNTQQGKFKYLAGYLMKCVQDHFNHNEDKLHAEAKSFTAALDAAVGTVRAAPPADPIARLADAQEIVTVRRNTHPKRKPETVVKELFSDV